MKKFKFLALTALLAMGTNAFATDYVYSANGLNYLIDGTNNVATVTGITTGSSAPATLTIAASITPTGDDADAAIKDNEYPIVAIGDAAFKNKTAITKIVLPTSVKTIGKNAFEGLTGLTIANFSWSPKTGSTIDDEAFKGCSQFAGELALPKWVATIGASAFENTGLTAITLATNAQLASVGSEFISGTNITELDFTKATIVTFADYALTSAKLKKVVFAAEFDEDSGLPSVECAIKTGANNNTISALMFSGATALEEVVFPSSLTTIAAGAFATSTPLKALDLSYTGVTAIEDLFQASSDFPRTALTSVKFSNGITAVKANAFGYCTGLTTLTFPSAWATNQLVKNNAFVGCTGLTTLTYEGSYTGADYTAGTYAGIFETNAFANCKTGTNKITLNVKTAYYTAVGGGTAANVPACIKYVKTDEAAAATDTWTITFPAGSNNQAFKYNPNGKDWTVSASDAIVYGVYVDQNTTDVANDGYDGTIYLIPYLVKQGKYTVSNTEAVIIKSKGEASVIATQATGGSLTSSKAGVNELKVNLVANKSISDIKTAAGAPNNGRQLWQGNILNGTLGFAKPASNTLAKGTYYVFSKKAYASAARMKIVWVDENDATAIETIQTKANQNGTIYNLSGQQVDANYKGIVIKNGKKYLQK